jgi:hypothetical protein
VQFVLHLAHGYLLIAQPAFLAILAQVHFLAALGEEVERLFKL